MTKPRHRRAGSRWRLQVHEWTGRKKNSPILYGTTHNVSSAAGEDSEHSRHHQLEGCDFDELVVSNWLHIEEMDVGLWWMEVGGVTLFVCADRDGNPRRVTVYGPGEFAEAVEGCVYELDLGPTSKPTAQPETPQGWTHD